MTLFSAIASVLFLFLLTRNISASMEYKDYARGKKGEVLYVMKDTRRWLLVLRVVSVVLILAIVIFFCIDIANAKRVLDLDLMRPLSIILGLLLFAAAPYSASRWVMTQDGIYIYNMNGFVPWSQMITSGVMTRRGSTYVTVQIKKEKHEYFKQPFQLLMIPSEDAKRIDDIIHEFIHALDKMKYLKRRKDEREEATMKKKTWY